MAASLRHLFEQKRSLAALSRLAIDAVAHRINGGQRASQPSETEREPGPGPWIEERVEGPSAALVRAFVRESGGDAGWYRDHVPVGLFPQWTFATMTRVLGSLPDDLSRVLNQGVTVSRTATIRSGVALVVRARLASVERDERRARFVTELETGTEEQPDAIVAKVHTYLPLGRSSQRSDRARPKSQETPGASARELATWSLAPTAGRDFAVLTGDVNPIHWLGPAAKLAGFRSPILHGFAQMARSIEALNRGVFVGDPARLSGFDVRFLRPLALPSRVALYVDRGGARFWVADGPNGPAYLSASYEVSP
jgi:acyl dehydratase